jgi:Protein of unknown function (DUF3485)
VWSFYVVDPRIAAGLFETKLLRARAVLLEREPVAAFVAISASMDDPKNPAERQLARFLAASHSFHRVSRGAAALNRYLLYVKMS